MQSRQAIDQSHQFIAIIRQLGDDVNFGISPPMNDVTISHIDRALKMVIKAS